MEEPDTTARKFVLNQVMNKQKEKPKDISQKTPVKLKPLQPIKPVQPVQTKPKPVQKHVQKNIQKISSTDTTDTTDTKKLKEELIESANVQKKLLNKARDELKTKKSTESVSSFNLPSPINNPWEPNLNTNRNFQLSPKFLLNRHYMASYAKYDNIASSRNINAAINSYIRRKKI